LVGSNGLAVGAAHADLRIEHLDMLRGAAALLVLLGHLRAFVFQNLASLEHASIGLKFFYAATSLGNQAVIIFFALSGYLVGGKALADMLDGRWRWDRYLLRRLTRLWIVLIPALALTLLLDFVGMEIGGKGYGGEFYSLYFSGPTALNNHSFTTLVGNLFFVQTIAVPVFGSNGPMWSLANEFWYYIAVPLAASVVFLRKRFFYGLMAFALLGFLTIWLPAGLLLAGLIWIAGAVAAWAARRASLARYFRNPGYLSIAALTAAVGLVYTKLPNSAYPELVFGITVALCLPALTHLPSPSPYYDHGARGLAEISYTLYLTHFPFLTFIFFTWAAPQRWAPGALPAAIYLAAAAAALLWAVLIWWCFERHTDRAFRFLEKRLVQRTKPQFRESRQPA
jgi:peptidoglycan/LPS O-acetylase OafA/YrhL